MAITAPDAEKDKLLRDNKRLRDIIPHALGLMIASQKQNPNVTPETDLEAFQNQGGYAPEEETSTPSSLTNRQKGKNVRKGDEAQRRAEESRGGEQLRPEDIWPNYPRMNIKPQDLLKILQLLPALTGGGLQMAGGVELPNFKPLKGKTVTGTRRGVLPMNETEIKRPLQIGPQANMQNSLERENVGTTLRDVMLPLLIKKYGKTPSGGYQNPGALLSGMKKLAQLPANNIRRLQDTGHMTIPQNPDGTGPLRIIDLLGPQNPPQA